MLVFMENNLVFSVGRPNSKSNNVLCVSTPPSPFSSGKLHHISSLDVIISKHMLKMAWQPPRKPKQITAKQSSDFPHDFVYSPRNHVDTYFSNMSGTGSHKWVWRQTRALKYDVGLQRLHHKWAKLTQASCVSAKTDGGVRRVKREECVRGIDAEKQTRWCAWILVHGPLMKNEDTIID